MRPRSVGTFLISRPETSAKLSARPEDALDVVAREVVDREQVRVHQIVSSMWAAASMATSSMPSISSTRTFTRSPRAVGRFLPT